MDRVQSLGVISEGSIHFAIHLQCRTACRMSLGVVRLQLDRLAVVSDRARNRVGQTRCPAIDVAWAKRVSS